MRMAKKNYEVNTELEKFKRSTRGFRVKRVTVSKKKPMKQSCLLCLLHQNLQPSFAREQSILPPSPRHVIFMHILPVLIALLQVNYQNKNVSPFDSHPTNMWIFFAAACIYGVGLVINMDENHRAIANSSDFISHVILSSGALASVSLASVFLPSLLGWFCLVLWTLLPAMLARHLIKHIYEMLKHATMNTISQACSRFNRFWSCVTLKTRNLPV